MIKDIIYNNLSQGLQFGSRWVLNIVLITILDIETYAIFSFVYSLSNILLSLLPFGSSVFLIAEANDSKKGVNLLTESIIVASFLFILVFTVYVGLTPFLNYIKGWAFSGYGIVLSYLLSLNLIVFSYFKGIGNFKKELQANAIFCIALLLFTLYAYLILVKTKNISLFFFVLIGLNFIIFVYSIFSSELKRRIFTSTGVIENSLVRIKEIFVDKVYYGLQEIVTAIYTQAGLLILFYVLDEKTYGYYRALFVVVAPVFMVTVAISQVILKHLKNSSNKIKVFRRIQLYTVVLGVIISIVIFASKKIIFSFIKIENSTVTNSSFYIIIGIVLVRFIFANYEMLLVLLNKQKQRFFVQLIAAIISIISIFVFLPHYGLVGAVSTNGLSYLIVSFGLILISENYLSK